MVDNGQIRVTALCSIDVVRTVIPGLRKPFRTTFSDSVTPEVNVTYCGEAFSQPPNSRARRSRHSSVMLIVAMSRSAADPRAKLAPPLSRKSFMACATQGGLGQLVAALFK